MDLKITCEEGKFSIGGNLHALDPTIELDMHNVRDIESFDDDKTKVLLRGYHGFSDLDDIMKFVEKNAKCGCGIVVIIPEDI